MPPRGFVAKSEKTQGRAQRTLLDVHCEHVVRIEARIAKIKAAIAAGPGWERNTPPDGRWRRGVD